MVQVQCFSNFFLLRIRFFGSKHVYRPSALENAPFQKGPTSGLRFSCSKPQLRQHFGVLFRQIYENGLSELFLAVGAFPFGISCRLHDSTFSHREKCSGPQFRRVEDSVPSCLRVEVPNDSFVRFLSSADFPPRPSSLLVRSSFFHCLSSMRVPSFLRVGMYHA